MSAEPGIRLRLVYSHRYQEALEAYEAEIKRAPPHLSELLADRAQMLLCLHRLDEALEGYRQANALRSKQTKGRSLPYLEAIGTVQWILGQRPDAVQTMQSAIDGILNGTFNYATTAGAIGQGMLLWYFGVALKDKNMIRY